MRPSSIPGAVSVPTQRDSFVKHIENQHVDIGRLNNPRTIPAESSTVTSTQVLSSEQSWDIEECKGPLPGCSLMVVMFLTILC